MPEMPGHELQVAGFAGQACAGRMPEGVPAEIRLSGELAGQPQPPAQPSAAQYPPNTGGIMPDAIG